MKSKKGFKKGTKKALGLTITALSVIMLTSCSDIAAQSITGDGEMDEAAIRAIFDKMTNYEMTREEFMQLDQETRGRVYDILLEEMARNRPPLTEEEIEELRIQDEEFRRTNLSYIVTGGDFTPASPDVDLQTIERFVFSDNVNIGGFTLVIDRLHGGVHFDRDTSRMFEHINYTQFLSSFQEQDLERLIQAIEESGLVDWEEHYRGRLDPYSTGGRAWTIGILFSDGTIMRRRGDGLHEDAFPPNNQFDILSDFIQTLGAEIEERHEAESEVAESEATESDDEE